MPPTPDQVRGRLVQGAEFDKRRGPARVTCDSEVFSRERHSSFLKCLCMIGKAPPVLIRRGSTLWEYLNQLDFKFECLSSKRVICVEDHAVFGNGRNSRNRRFSLVCANLQFIT